MAGACLAAVAAALLAGCAAGPDFVRPAAPDVPAYTAAPLPQATASAAAPLGQSQRFTPATSVDAAWWRAFGSPRLDALVDQALRASPTLAAAEARMRQAQETQAAQAGSTRYPTVQAGAGAQRQRTSASTAAPAASGLVTQYNAGLDIRYRLDVSGGDRRALEALAARTDHRRFEFEGAQLTLAGSIVSAAIQQARVAGQIGATEEILKAQEDQLTLTRERVRLGHVEYRELLPLIAQLEQTRAALSSLRKQHDQTGHLLAVLAGRAPGAGGLPRFTLDDFMLPPDLSYVLPSELVRRRPDIRAAEALLQAANAEYGVAVASLYPRIDLSANLASQALSAGSLFGAGSAAWGLVAQLTQPLFDAGLPARKRASLAAFDAAAGNYRSVVLESLREVADVLRAAEHDASALKSLAAASDAAQRSFEVVQSRYRLGAATYVELTIAYQQWQQTRLELVSVQSQRLLDTAALYQASGGPVG
ncbi:MAG TPA: efflux transporter outer membrane subunit [Ramlibacter sp.]